MSPDDVARRAQAVRPLLARLLGEEPGRMVHQTYGHGNLVFALPDRGLVAKTSPDLVAYAHTARNVAILGALGVPVPRVVAAGDDGERAVIVLEWLPGSDLGFALPSMTTGQKRTLAWQVAEIEARVGALPSGKGFGWTPIDVPGGFPTWLAVVERDHGRLPSPYRERIDLAPWRRVLRALPPTPFLDDLTVKNVLVHEGRLSGVVDLDSICYGDPLYWLALAETTAVLDCDDADYGRLLRRAWGPTALGGRRTDLYAAMFAASFLKRPNARMELFFERRLRRSFAR